MINAPFELDIYITNNEIRQKQKLELDFDYSECDIQKATFYNIVAIYPCTDGGKIHGTYVCCNGQEIVTPMEYEKLKALINKRI
jgi:hypothetical protein